MARNVFEACSSNHHTPDVKFKRCSLNDFEAHRPDCRSSNFKTSLSLPYQNKMNPQYATRVVSTQAFEASLQSRVKLRDARGQQGRGDEGG